MTAPNLPGVDQEEARRKRAVEEARDALVDALQSWHIDGRTVYLSERIRRAIRQLDQATEGGIAAMARATRMEIR